MNNPQKSRRGLDRVLHAFRFSVRGLCHGWEEAAFRQEVVLTTLLAPLAMWLGQTWLERAVLIAVLLLVLVVELLNSAVESAIDRIGADWHDLSGRAKDLGSAAVLLSLMLAAVVWISAIWSRWMA